MPTQSMTNGQVDEIEPLGYVLHYTLTLIFAVIIKNIVPIAPSILKILRP